MCLHDRLEEPFRRDSPANLMHPHVLLVRNRSRVHSLGHVAILLVTANINEIPVIVCQFSFGMERVLGSLWH